MSASGSVSSAGADGRRRQSSIAVSVRPLWLHPLPLPTLLQRCRAFGLCRVRGSPLERSDTPDVRQSAVLVVGMNAVRRKGGVSDLRGSVYRGHSPGLGRRRRPRPAKRADDVLPVSGGRNLPAGLGSLQYGRRLSRGEVAMGRLFVELSQTMKGRRKNKSGEVRIRKCKQCGRRWTPKAKQYRPGNRVLPSSAARCQVATGPPCICSSPEARSPSSTVGWGT
jgi:hypothetical protein